MCSMGLTGLLNRPLTSGEQTANVEGMDDRDCLAHYPFVVVRIACRLCTRRGSYRLARLAAKYGSEISLRDLTERFSYDCLWRAKARSKRGVSACGVQETVAKLKAVAATPAAALGFAFFLLLVRIPILRPHKASIRPRRP